MKNKPVPDALSREDMNALYGWLVKRYREQFLLRGQIDRTRLKVFVEDQVEDCLDFHRGTGNKRGYVEWRSACRRWMRNRMKWDGHEPKTVVEPRRLVKKKPADLGMTPLFDLIQGGKP